MAQPIDRFRLRNFGNRTNVQQQDTAPQFEDTSADQAEQGATTLEKFLGKAGDIGGGIKMEKQSPLAAFGKQLMGRTKIGSAINAYQDQVKINQAADVQESLSTGGQFKYERASAPVYTDENGNAITDKETIAKLNQQTGFSDSDMTLTNASAKGKGLVKLVDNVTGEVLNEKKVTLDVGTREIGPDGNPIVKQVTQTVYVNPDTYLSDPNVRKELILKKTEENMKNIGLDRDVIDRTINNLRNTVNSDQLKIAQANMKLKTLKSDFFLANLGTSLGGEKSPGTGGSKTDSVIDEYTKSKNVKDAELPEKIFSLTGGTGGALTNDSDFTTAITADKALGNAGIKDENTVATLKGFINVQTQAKAGDPKGTLSIASTANIGTAIGVYLKSDGDNIEATNFDDDNWAESKDTHKKMRMAVELGIINKNYVNLPYAERMQLMKTAVVLMDETVIPELRKFQEGFNESDRIKYMKSYDSLKGLAAEKIRIQEEIKSVSKMSMLSGEGANIQENGERIEGAGIFVNSDSPQTPKYSVEINEEGYSETLSFDVIDERLRSMSREEAGSYLGDLVDRKILKPEAAQHFADKLNYQRSKTANLQKDLEKINALGRFGSVQSAANAELPGPAQDKTSILGMDSVSDVYDLKFKKGQLVFNEKEGKFITTKGIGVSGFGVTDASETVVRANAGHRLNLDYGKLRDKGYNDVTRAEYLEVIKRKANSDDPEVLNKMQTRLGVDDGEFEIIKAFLRQNNVEELMEFLDEVQSSARERTDRAPDVTSGFFG
jgi:hypothetical protein